MVEEPSEAANILKDVKKTTGRKKRQCFLLPVDVLYCAIFFIRQKMASNYV